MASGRSGNSGKESLSNLEFYSYELVPQSGPAQRQTHKIKSDKKRAHLESKSRKKNKYKEGEKDTMQNEGELE